MSADNGIYVLKTKGAGEKGFEYRVLHAQAIENIYYRPDKEESQEDFVPEEAFIYFKECQVLYDEGRVLTYAHRLADDCPILEYGVVVLDHGEQVFQTFTDEEIKNHRKKQEEQIQRVREERNRQWEQKREAAKIPVLGETSLKPTAIYVYMVIDGEEVHGSLQNVESITIEGNAYFLPTDWHKE